MKTIDEMIQFVFEKRDKEVQKLERRKTVLHRATVLSATLIIVIASIGVYTGVRYSADNDLGKFTQLMIKHIDDNDLEAYIGFKESGEDYYEYALTYAFEQVGYDFEDVEAYENEVQFEGEMFDEKGEFTSEYIEWNKQNEDRRHKADEMMNAITEKENEYPRIKTKEYNTLMAEKAGLTDDEIIEISDMGFYVKVKVRNLKRLKKIAESDEVTDITYTPYKAADEEQYITEFIQEMPDKIPGKTNTITKEDSFVRLTIEYPKEIKHREYFITKVRIENTSGREISYVIPMESEGLHKEIDIEFSGEGVRFTDLDALNKAVTDANVIKVLKPGQIIEETIHFAPGKIHDRYSGSADEINEFYDPGDYPVTVSFYYSLPEGENDYSGQSSSKLSAEFSFKIVGDGKMVIHTGSSVTDHS